MLVLLILGILDLLAGSTLYFITDISIVKLIAIFLIAKGCWTIFKNFFKW
jgi:uncharacterized membrane protein HdeD (DUF308 family)